MMRRAHLTAEAVVDVIDGRATDAVAAHLDVCDVCRSRVDEARAALTTALDADVPEPSPLFWDHLSARVARAVAEEPAAATNWRAWWSRRWLVSAVAATAAVVVLLVAVPRPWAPADQPARSVQGAPDDPGEAEQAGVIEPLRPADDEGWDVVTALSEGLADDASEAPALEPMPGAAERAVDALDADERVELVRLLEAELARRPS